MDEIKSADGSAIECVVRRVGRISGGSHGETHRTGTSDTLPAKLTLHGVRIVAPALDRYTPGALGDLWKCPELSSAASLPGGLIARNQTPELP